MKYTLPLDGTVILESAAVPSVREPAYKGLNWQASETEYAVQVEGVGDFHVFGGREVTFCPVPGADPDWVRLYLNGLVLVALLHQRKVISFHASSFIYGGRCVMILGETGAGKTSLTVAFAVKGAGFMSDDLTPVAFRENVSHIWSLSRKIKLRADSIEQLEIGRGNLSEAESGTGKKYLHIEKGAEEYHRLDVIVKIETGDVEEPVFINALPAEKFALLRSEVCSWEILAGMPETEAAYLQQLVQILEQVHFVKVIRPPMITIAGMHYSMKLYLDSLS